MISGMIFSRRGKLQPCREVDTDTAVEDPAVLATSGSGRSSSRSREGAGIAARASGAAGDRCELAGALPRRHCLILSRRLSTHAVVKIPPGDDQPRIGGMRGADQRVRTAAWLRLAVAAKGSSSTTRLSGVMAEVTRLGRGGKRPGAGRKPGSPNKHTGATIATDLKEALAFLHRINGASIVSAATSVW
jgi:hypothetical protein